MIPKIFHHTWPSSGAFPERYAKFRDSFMALHPDWTFMFWSREDRSRYALSEESRSLQAPDSPLRWIVVSDIMRHEILFQYGGVYLDTDMQAIKNFDPLLYDESFVAESYAPDTIGQGVVGTVPGNPLFERLAMEVVCNILKCGVEAANVTPADVSGPGLSARFLCKAEKVYPRKYFYPFSWSEVNRYRYGEDFDPTALFPKSYALHWWDGANGGWTCQKHDR